MNLKQLKYALVLAQEGSFSRAAETLNISQPSLSQYIKKIETQVGAELFKRTSGEVQLTDAGRAYLEAGKKILSLEHQMQNQLADLTEYRGGTVCIGISPYRSVHMIPRVLQEFDRLYPNVRLIVREKSGHELLDAAIHGEFDLCVISLPVDASCFECETILREEIVIAVKKDTELYARLCENAKTQNGRKFPAVDLHLVEGCDFAMLDEYMRMRIVTDRILEQASVQIREKVGLSSNEALLSAAATGVCAAFVPSGMVDGASEQLGFFSLCQDAVFRDVGLIRRKDQYLSRPIKALIEIFRTFA